MNMPLWAWREGLEWTGPPCICTDCQEEGGCEGCEACALEAEYRKEKKEKKR